MRFDGRVALITGAASGIGRGCVERFLADGARVAALDVDAEAGRQMVADLAGQGDIAFEECDVGVKTAVDRAVAAVLARFGTIDVLVNNAGITRAGDFLAMREEDFDLVIQTNLKSVFLFGQAVGRHMVERGKGGAIVNMSSTSVIMTMPNIAPYAASKGGISSLTRAMALHFAPHNIRVNAVGPGTIVTKMTQSRSLQDPAQVRRILSRTPLGRFGQPSDVASVVAFLASDDAGYVTGQTLYVDGGRAGLNYTVPVPE
ncbi:MAG: SDR family oxidoreductase [Alphaproteobacteria bacterium]|nr:SDR family oxidoreductase [Alphaproteobacteria bacterium]